jgi:hypothetical protein
MNINIIIRTSYRPKAFARCIESIRSQTIPNNVGVNLFISFDNPMALDYVKTISATEIVNLTSFERSGIFFYNGYLNVMINHPSIKDGHILFLDDDDELSPNFLVDASKFIKPGYSYIFPFVRPNGFQKPTPAMMAAQRISQGYIGLPCLLLSTTHRHHVHFNQSELADYDAISLLSLQVNLIWVNLPIVRATVRGFGVMEEKH